MCLELVEEFRRPHRDGVAIAHHGTAIGGEGVAPAELDGIERQRRRRLVDQRFQRGHGLHGAVAAHRSGGDAVAVQRHRGHVDLRDVVDADGRRRRHGGDVRREVPEAAAVEDVVRREGRDLARPAVDPDPGVHLEGVAFDAALELLEAVMRQADGAAGKEDRRQRDVEDERRVVAPSEAAAHIGEVGLDVLGLERGLGLAQQGGDRLRALVGRLDAEHEFQLAALAVVPAETAFGLEEHRVDRLGLEASVQHQKVRICFRQFGADLLAVLGRLAVGLCRLLGEGLPDREGGMLHAARAHPAGEDRRVDVRRLRGRPGDAGEAEGAVILALDGAGLLPEFDQGAVPERRAGPVIGIEAVEDQQCHGLTEIQGRLAQRTEQVAGIEFRNREVGLLDILRRHDHRRLERSLQTLEVEAEIDMRRVRRPHQQRVRRLLRPARHVGSPDVGGVELRARHLRGAVDAAEASDRGIPVVPARQRLAGRKAGFLGDGKTGEAKGNATRSDPGHELAARRAHICVPQVYFRGKT